VTKQTVYVVGPVDKQLYEMWNQSSFYKMCFTPESADVICFQGGADVHPKLYGEEELEETYPDPYRDEEDIEFYSSNQGKPLVGICRGGQFLNVMAGGEMYQDVNNHGTGHEAINLLDIPGTTWTHGRLLEVTSDHHQMMIPSDLGEVLMVAHKTTRYRSPTERPLPQYDVEAVWYEHLNALCFQPHPEYNSRYETRSTFFAYMRYFYG